MTKKTVTSLWFGSCLAPFLRAIGEAFVVVFGDSSAARGGVNANPVVETTGVLGKQPPETLPSIVLFIGCAVCVSLLGLPRTAPIFCGWDIAT